VALFFLAFLPQFINPASTYGPLPFMFLGLTFMTTGIIWCLVLAHAASYFTRTLRKNPLIGRILQKISGIIFVGLGIRILISK
jgi:threonine/homoserine/homoserine lactone efflux protein